MLRITEEYWYRAIELGIIEPPIDCNECEPPIRLIKINYVYEHANLLVFGQSSNEKKAAEAAEEVFRLFESFSYAATPQLVALYWQAVLAHLNQLQKSNEGVMIQPELAKIAEAYEVNLRSAERLCEIVKEGIGDGEMGADTARSILNMLNETLDRFVKAVLIGKVAFKYPKETRYKEGYLRRSSPIARMIKNLKLAYPQDTRQYRWSRPERQFNLAPRKSRKRRR